MSLSRIAVVVIMMTDAFNQRGRRRTGNPNNLSVNGIPLALPTRQEHPTGSMATGGRLTPLKGKVVLAVCPGRNRSNKELYAIRHCA